MSNLVFLNNSDILATLRELNALVTKPLWLFGGVAVDFLVGRWTRPHGDIDLNTLWDYRDDLTQELHRAGYHTSDSGWITKWFQKDSTRSLEIVFLERSADGMIILHIREGDAIGIPGYYPLLLDYLNPDRYAELEGVRFRVSSPSGEWLARANSIDVVGGRAREPKLEHDQKLLEEVLPDEELVYLQSLVKTG